MRYCPYCKRINEGWPIRCRYCACTWAVRYCRSGHENPPNALFCGECGSADLSTPALGGRIQNWFFKLPQSRGVFIKMALLLLPVLLLVVLVRNLNASLPLLFAVTVMILIFKLTVDSLPKTVKGSIWKYYRALVRNKNNRAGKAR